MKAFKYSGIFLALLSVAACSAVDKITKKINPGSEPSNPSQNLAAVSASNGDIQVRVTGIAKAKEGWLAYNMTVSNPGKAVIADLKGYVIDKEGREFEAATDDAMLNEPPKLAEDLLINTGAAIGGMGLAMAGIPFIGPLLMGGVLLYQVSETDDSLSSSLGFIRTTLTGGTIHINDERKGAFFFPAVNAEKLKITYLLGNTRKSIVIGPNNNNAVRQTTAEASTTTGKVTVAAAPMSLAEAQRRLKSIGYDPGPLDGRRGKKTETAITQFQKDSGLPVTGQLDAATIEALKSRY